MNITQITWKFFSNDPTDRILAMCSIIVNEQLVIHEVRVIRGRTRTFVAYPNKEYNAHSKNGSVYPIDDELRRRWEAQILDSYYKEKKCQI